VVLVALALLAALLDAAQRVRRGLPLPQVIAAALKSLVVPALIVAVTLWAAPRKLPLVVQSLLTLAIVTPLGPLVYRLAYEKLADATVLVLLIVSVGVHFALTGLGLVSSAPRASATRASGTPVSRRARCRSPARRSSSSWSRSR
jgi:branched-chain amino acid transport system permease protein